MTFGKTKTLLNFMRHTVKSLLKRTVSTIITKEGPLHYPLSNAYKGKFRVRLFGEFTMSTWKAGGTSSLQLHDSPQKASIMHWHLQRIQSLQTKQQQVLPIKLLFLLKVLVNFSLIREEWCDKGLHRLTSSACSIDPEPTCHRLTDCQRYPHSYFHGHDGL